MNSKLSNCTCGVELGLFPDNRTEQYRKIDIRKIFADAFEQGLKHRSNARPQVAYCSYKMAANIKYDKIHNCCFAFFYKNT